MSLPIDVVNQFIKATKDDSKQSKKESTLYATIVEYEGSKWARIDGSDRLTPISTTTDIKPDERVIVTIKDHTAIVTGNLSSPAARMNDVKDNASKISEFEIVVAYRVTAEEISAINAAIENLRAKTAVIENADIANAHIDKLEAIFADLETVTAKDADIINAEIENLNATFGTFTDLSTEQLDAIYAVIDELHGYTADFTYVSADVLSALKASIKTLDTEKLNAKDATIKYANIDFSNIGQAAIEKFLSESGIIEDLVVSEGHITGRLVGVTIIGDVIEGGTIKADKLVVLGENGLYYKLNVNAETVSAEQTEYNSLSGSIITAKSITAEKVRVDDLVAFDATIAGLNLTEGTLYSGVKSSVNNTTKGFYLDKYGQLALGDSNNFIRYYKDPSGENYKLEISASSVIFGATNKTIMETIDDIKIGGRNLIRNSPTMIFNDYYFENVPVINGDFITDSEDNILLDEGDNMLFV